MYERDIRLSVADIIESIDAVEDFVKDFRNVIVHEYFGIDNGIVWDAVKQELPLLKIHIRRLNESLATERH
jgi:uncharacterized protein YutE (UPF0331/DUF86 family)